MNPDRELLNIGALGYGVKAKTNSVAQKGAKTLESAKIAQELQEFTRISRNIKKFMGIHEIQDIQKLLRRNSAKSRK